MKRDMRLYIVRTKIYRIYKLRVVSIKSLDFSVISYIYSLRSSFNAFIHIILAPCCIIWENSILNILKIKFCFCRTFISIYQLMSKCCRWLHKIVKTVHCYTVCLVILSSFNWSPCSLKSKLVEHVSLLVCTLTLLAFRLIFSLFYDKSIQFFLSLFECSVKM